LIDQLLEIRATRVYIILVATSVIILAFYSSVTVHTLTVLVLAPSLDTFERLQNDYSSTLVCPCSELAIPNGKMITISSPRYHQVRTMILKTS
jgi:hypothetical protein